MTTDKGFEIIPFPGAIKVHISGASNYASTSYDDYIEISQPTPFVVTGTNGNYLLPGTSGTIRFSLLPGYS